MAMTPGVRRRAVSKNSGLLQAHVDIAVRERARELATAAGVSMAAFLEYAILSQEVGPDGRPTCVPDMPQDEELPLASVS